MLEFPTGRFVAANVAADDVALDLIRQPESVGPANTAFQSNESQLPSVISEDYVSSISRQVMDDETAALVGAVTPSNYLAPLPSVEVAPSSGRVVEEAADLELSIEDLLWRAEAEHPLLEARRHEIAMAQARILAVDVYQNPEIVLDAQSRLDDSGPTQLATRLEFGLPRPGRRRARVAAAAAGVSQARAAYDREAQTILRQATIAALEVVYLQELSILEEQLSALAASRAEQLTAETADRGPEATLVDRIQADVDAKTTKARWLATLSDLEVARVELVRSIGLPGDARIRVTDHLASALAPLPTWGDLVSFTGPLDPEVSEAIAALRASRRRYDVAQLEAIPDAVFGPRFDDNLGEDNDQVGARFSADLPIFDRNQGAICESAAQIRRDRAGLRAAELDALARLATAYRELAAQRRQLEFFETDVRVAVRSHEQALSDPELRGLVRFDRSLEIQQELIDLKRQELEVRRNCALLQMELEQILGQSLSAIPIAYSVPEASAEEIEAPPRLERP